MQTIRWGIIGVGRFGNVHAAALRSVPGCEATALCTRDAGRLADAAKQHGVERTCTDYRALLEDADVDVVDITTHWRQHFEIARAALESGKHVFLEKPMAATADECRDLLAAAEAARGLFMVGHVCRFDPRITLAKQAVDAGRLGRIISMHARRNLPVAPGPLRLDKISPLMGDGIHDADLMMWLAGRTPTSVYARNIRVDDFQYPDIGWAMLHFGDEKSGDEAIGVVETNWRLPRNAPTAIDARLEVVGTEGQVTVDCAHAGLAILDAGGLQMPDTAYWPQQHGRIVGALCHELAYFADCVRTGEPPTVITPREAARAVMVMEAAEQSAACGAPVELGELA